MKTWVSKARTVLTTLYKTWSTLFVFVKICWFQYSQIFSKNRKLRSEFIFYLLIFAAASIKQNSQNENVETLLKLQRSICKETTSIFLFSKIKWNIKAEVKDDDEVDLDVNHAVMEKFVLPQQSWSDREKNTWYLSKILSLLHSNNNDHHILYFVPEFFVIKFKRPLTQRILCFLFFFFLVDH